MPEKKDNMMNLNITVVALVALVAIVGVTAIVLNGGAGRAASQASSASQATDTAGSAYALRTYGGSGYVGPPEAQSGDGTGSPAMMARNGGDCSDCLQFASCLQCKSSGLCSSC